MAFKDVPATLQKVRMPIHRSDVDQRLNSRQFLNAMSQIDTFGESLS
jgi:hypothetical protein